MRFTLLAAALLLGSATAPAADPPLPPITFQVQPFGRVLDEFRGAANLVGGEKAVKGVNEAIKGTFGEKGVEGLDIGRPIVGYVILAPKPEDITAVIALPVTSEKDFLALCDRTNKDKLRVDAKDKTLYHLPPLSPTYKAMMRFSEGYAYIAYGYNPAAHIEAKALVPMPKLYDPADRGLITGRLHFDRIPADVRKAAPRLFEEVKNTLLGGPGGFGFGRQEQTLLKPAIAEFEKLALRYLVLANGADTLTARIYFDQPAGTFVAEGVLTGKPDTELSKIIANYKDTPNKFAAIGAHPDTVASVRGRLPLFEPEIRTGIALGIEALQKEAAMNGRDVSKAVQAELFKGLIRTVKTGEFDIVAAVRGPDKDGAFTAVGAIAFDDPAALEKEFKAFVAKDAPADVVDAIKWDADKVGKVNIHTWKMTQGGFIDVTKVFGGDKCVLAFAFAPNGVFAAMGPDAIATLKDALAVKPVAAPVLDVSINHARMRKLIRAMAPNPAEAAKVEELFGKEDKLISAGSITLTGGKELTARFTLDMKTLPKFLVTYLMVESSRVEPIEPPPPPVEKN